MPAPAATPPATSTAAPSPATTSVPAPAPTSPEAKPAGAPPENPFDLDAAWKSVESPPKGDAKPPELKKPEPAPKTETAPVEKTKPFQAPKEMRDHISKLESDLKARNTELEGFRGRAKEQTALTERVAALEKERDDAMAQIRALRQEKSPEFIKQYEKPFKDAANYAKTIVESLSVVTGPDGTTRPATWDEDFAGLYSLPPGKASKLAREMFGDDAPTVINHLQELHRLDYIKNQALAEERENAKARSTEEEANGARQREQIKERWVQVNKDLAEGVDEYHDPPEETESAQVRAKALSIYDSQPKTLNEKIVKDAHIRHIVGAHPVLKRKVKLLTTQLAEAQKELESFKHPQPKGAKRAATTGTTPEKDWETDLRESVTA